MIRQILALSIGMGLMLGPAAAQESKNYTPPKTPWGEADLRGTWPLNNLIATPLQRPEKYGNQRLLTDEEYAAAQKRAQARNQRFESGAIPAADSGTQVLRLTSLLSYPENGRFPALTPHGQELYAQMHGSYKPGQTVFDSPADFDEWDHCITRGMPVSMEPRNYNNGLRIMQSPGYVLIVLEMAHEVRIIPTTPQPAPDPAIKTWLGVSRGHWEGNTLVVETTNFNGKNDLTNAGVPGSPPLTPSSEEEHITERFTRTAPDSIDYQMRVEDPDVIVSPFEIHYPMKLDNSYQMYEYACHEGNEAIRGYIVNSRYERAHPKSKTPAPPSK
ncbi:MAG TPA: hypothetical protein VJ732_11480 [Bryobacteraceae bacterium]|nr:hypothetical protein [Bryobacteraceae bacterium]